MKDAKAVGIITRGYARHAKDEERLRAVGVKTVYRADKDEGLGKFKMRHGELLGVVDGLRAFGDTRRDMVAAIKLVHGFGATVIDAEYGQRSDRDGVEMLHSALAKFRPSAEFAAEMQAASVRAHLKGRLPKREALAIWRNPKYSTVEAVELMYKWTQTTAYKELGPRGVPAGRRAK